MTQQAAETSLDVAANERAPRPEWEVVQRSCVKASSERPQPKLLGKTFILFAGYLP